MNQELAKTKTQFKAQMEDCQEVILENDRLREQLEAQKREFQKHLQTRKDQVGVLNEGEEQASSNEEVMDLKNRAHLLSEENQVLFQQV